ILNNGQNGGRKHERCERRESKHVRIQPAQRHIQAEREPCPCSLVITKFGVDKCNERGSALVEERLALRWLDVTALLPDSFLFILKTFFGRLVLVHFPPSYGCILYVHDSTGLSR